MAILNVTTEVNSPKISPTDTSGLSETISNGNGFQFLIIIAPKIKIENKKKI